LEKFPPYITSGVSSQVHKPTVQSIFIQPPYPRFTFGSSRLYLPKERFQFVGLNKSNLIDSFRKKNIDLTPFFSNTNYFIKIPVRILSEN